MIYFSYSPVPGAQAAPATLLPGQELGMVAVEGMNSQ